VLQKAVTAGSWVVVATVSHIQTTSVSIGGSFPYVTNCELRDLSGGFLGSVGASGLLREAFSDSNALTLNGGTFVPDGQVKTIGLWCRVSGPGASAGGAFGSAQMLIMQVGGFGI
jgi:hypothetical protein